MNRLLRPDTELASDDSPLALRQARAGIDAAERGTVLTSARVLEGGLWVHGVEPARRALGRVGPAGSEGNRGSRSVSQLPTQGMTDRSEE
jgi:hypothetical protein